MKRNLLFNLTVYCFTLMITSCQGKVSNEQATESIDSLKAKNIFAEYTADPCLSRLLTSIVKSNKQFYNNEEYFYSVTLKLNNGNRRMTIDARLWDAPGSQLYKGVLKIDGAFFLCSADIEKDSLFKIKEGSVIKTPFKEESPNNESFPYAEEPTLKGKLVDCGDKPIYIEIYTRGKMSMQ